MPIITSHDKHDKYVVVSADKDSINNIFKCKLFY